MKKSTINRELIRNIMLWIIENEEDVQKEINDSGYNAREG